MNEWTVVSVLVVLVGLMISIAKPIISLNSTITKLTEAVRMLERNIDSLSAKNSEAHAGLWNKSGEHDSTLRELEFRLQKIESERCRNHPAQ